MGRALDQVLSEIRRCAVCAANLPLGPRPIVQLGGAARVLVIGQAPGSKVHASGVPWRDRSGDRLREWMGIDEETFYDDKSGRAHPHGVLLSRRRRQRRLAAPPGMCAALA